MHTQPLCKHWCTVSLYVNTGPKRVNGTLFMASMRRWKWRQAWTLFTTPMGMWRVQPDPCLRHILGVWRKQPEPCLRHLWVDGNEWPWTMFTISMGSVESTLNPVYGAFGEWNWKQTWTLLKAPIRNVKRETQTLFTAIMKRWKWRQTWTLFTDPMVSEETRMWPYYF